VFVQDHLKLSIQLNEDSPSPAPGTLPSESSLAPTRETNPGTLTRPTGQA
jgi:hypothetical protein